MAKIDINMAINVPDKPSGLDIPDQAWDRMMRNVWIRWWKIYYDQYQEEIDVSLQDFTNKVFTALQTQAAAVPDSVVGVPGGQSGGSEASNSDGCTAS